MASMLMSLLPSLLGGGSSSGGAGGLLGGLLQPLTQMMQPLEQMLQRSFQGMQGQQQGQGQYGFHGGGHGPIQIQNRQPYSNGGIDVNIQSNPNSGLNIGVSGGGFNVNIQTGGQNYGNYGGGGNFASRAGSQVDGMMSHATSLMNATKPDGTPDIAKQMQGQQLMQQATNMQQMFSKLIESKGDAAKNAIQNIH